MSARPKKSAGPADNALLRISQHRCEIWRDGRFPLAAAYGPTITRSVSRLIVRRLSRPRYSRLQLQCADEEVSFSVLGNQGQAGKFFPGPLPAKPLALTRSAFRTRVGNVHSWMSSKQDQTQTCRSEGVWRGCANLRKPTIGRAGGSTRKRQVSSQPRRRCWPGCWMSCTQRPRAVVVAIWRWSSR